MRSKWTNRISTVQEKEQPMANNVVSRFLGGPPLAVLARLVLLSIVVGVILSAVGLDPRNILRSVEKLIEEVWDMGFDAVRWLWRYFLLGAALGVSFIAAGATGYLLFAGIGLLSVAIGLDGDLLPYATRSYFGLRSYSTIYGMLGAAYSLGPPVGSFMLGQGFDRFGGYTPLLWGIVGIVTLSALLLMALGRPDSPEYRVRAMSHLRARA